MFGIFEHHICDGFQHLPIFRGFDDVFYVPHSRHTEVRREDIEKCEGLQVISESADSGVHIVMARGGREFFVTGHSEYSPILWTRSIAVTWIRDFLLKCLETIIVRTIRRKDRWYAGEVWPTSCSPIG